MKQIKVRMTLLSDTIFGSGQSIPGGEDIAVLMDQDGFPYFSASAFKGVLREAAENVLAWHDGKAERAVSIFGSEWQEGSVHLTDLTLPEKVRAITWIELGDAVAVTVALTDLRTFTQLDEDGSVKEGSLRTARCVIRGLYFEGQLSCAEEDAALLEEALTSIRWIGTMRNRGFGEVQFTYQEVAE